MKVCICFKHVWKVGGRQLPRRLYHGVVIAVWWGGSRCGSGWRQQRRRVLPWRKWSKGLVSLCLVSLCLLGLCLLSLRLLSPGLVSQVQFVTGQWDGLLASKYNAVPHICHGEEFLLFAVESEARTLQIQYHKGET